VERLPKLWPRSPITKIQGLVGTPLSRPPWELSTGFPKGSTTESQGMEWMSMGARVSNWNCMLFNLIPLHRRPGHTHTLYESNMGTGGLMDGKVDELLVNQGQTVVFSSSFCHAGGSNYTINKAGYVYCLFAYIVLAEAYYLPKLEKGSDIEA
jgi:hypothetical protein